MTPSETVFVLPPTDPSAEYRLRFFTPARVIPFAGHPVIGAFYVLAHLGVLRLQEPVTRIHQETSVGGFPLELTVRDGQVRQFSLNQPKPEFIGLVRPLGNICDFPKGITGPTSQLTG